MGGEGEEGEEGGCRQVWGSLGVGGEARLVELIRHGAELIEAAGAEHGECSAHQVFPVALHSRVDSHLLLRPVEQQLKEIIACELIARPFEEQPEERRDAANR